MSEGFTPGPYLRQGRTVYALNRDGFNRFSALVQDAHTPEEELVATAALMQAAPDLYQHAEALLNDVMQRYGITEDGLTCPHMRGLAAALAKAKGQ